MKQWTAYHLINRVLVITAVVAALPMAVGFVLIQHSARTRLSDASGTNFVWFAEHAASALDVAFLREMEFLASVASLSQSVASSDVSRLLISLEEANPVYRGMEILDLEGSSIAASAEPTPSSVESEETFQRALSRARSSSEFSDSWLEVEIIEGTVTLYGPLRGPESRDVRGMIRASLDAERLFASVSGLRFGETGHACLFERATGRLLAGSGSLCGSEGVYIRLEDLNRARAQQNAYFLAEVRGPASFERSDATLVAHTRPELSRSIPEADWVVAVEQTLKEANAPLAPLGRELVTHFLLMGALVVILAFYLSYRLERPEIDVSVDLHGGTVRPSRPGDKDR